MNKEKADFTPAKRDYMNIPLFVPQNIIANFPFIDDTFDALTLKQLIAKIVEYLNDVINNNKQMVMSMDDFYTAFTQLQDYVNNYFDGIQVVKVEVVSHSLYTRVYRITFYNNYSFEFEVSDGQPNTLFIGNVTASAPGSDPAVSIRGSSPFQTLDFVLPRGDTGPTGNGIEKIEPWSRWIDQETGGYVQQYKITYTNGDTFLYQVNDGLKGDTGPQGPQGVPGPQGETGPMPDMSEYIKNTDFATGNKPGIVKSNDGYGSHIYNGIIEGVTRTFDDYNRVTHDHFLICKKTLDNVLATHTRNITLFESQNGYDGDSVASGSEITLSDSLKNYDYIEVYTLLGGTDSICTKFIPSQNTNQYININHSTLDYGRQGFTVPDNYFINLTYDDTTKKLSCTGSGYYEPFVDSGNNIDNRITNTNTNTIQKIVGVKVL